MRQGKWKDLNVNADLHGYAVEHDQQKTEELDDLDCDLGEQSNLAAKHPGTVAKLKPLVLSIKDNEWLAPSDNKQ